jgi:hypothetical protein
MKHVVTFESILMALVRKYSPNGVIELSARELDVVTEKHSGECVYANVIGPDGQPTPSGNEATGCRLEIVSKREAGRRWHRRREIVEEYTRTHGGVIVLEGPIPEKPAREGDN